MTPDREAAAGLVEGMPGVCDALDRADMHILAKFCRNVAPTITTLLSELERVGKERDQAIADNAHNEEYVDILESKSRSLAAAQALVAEAARVAEHYAERFCKYTDGKVCGAIEDALCPGCAAFEFIEKAKS